MSKLTLVEVQANSHGEEIAGQLSSWWKYGASSRLRRVSQLTMAEVSQLTYSDMRPLWLDLAVQQTVLAISPKQSMETTPLK
ncbi:hypothetical protein AVEN_162694-1 [Araneus ventricosus]|uniref:Uncharacterized protein n=1 Tax=Araneus ventricosus TaxID=182803 RepID=A0A4Y2UUA5_ARAVE|nr:hypothetical protein AVEN_162694-1 [Araneus ventricosus]